ncbi:MAG: hypothetical protein M1820_007430 [Bogoriella megaspora]|nr:MAG: hypothetical protein M1820_007430 [Bogoriella megaspora]
MAYTLSIDLGTKTSSCCFRTPKDPFPMILGLLHPISFKNRVNETPTLATWLADGSFCWGDALQEEMNKPNPQISYENLLSLPKLLFYNQHETEEIVHDLTKKLDRLGKSKHDVITGLLKGLWEHSLNQIHDEFPMAGVKKTQLKDRVEVLLSVPQNFNVEQDEHVARAARDAGIPKFKIVSESECGASYHLQCVKQQQRRSDLQLYRKGDRIAVADLGGGTNDFGIYSCDEPIKKGGPDTALSPIQPTLDSRLSGSEFVNEQFRRFMRFEWTGVVTTNQSGVFRGEEANFEKACSMVQTEPERALMDLCRQFEEHKQHWDGQRPDWQAALIAGHLQSFHIQLRNDHMKKFFEPSVQSIISWLQEYRSYDYKLILLTGGFSKSDYVRRLIEAEFQVPSSLMIPRDASNFPPVACGAILRYQNIRLNRQDLHPISYGVVNDSEPYDEQHHPDGRVTDCTDSRFGEWDNMIVKTDPHTGEYVVEDRVASWMTRKGDSASRRKIYWQLFAVRDRDRTMSARICWTTKSDVVDHEPLYVRKNDPNDVSQLRQGFHLLEEISTPVRPEKYGYKPKRFSKSGERVFEVHAAIALNMVDGRLQFQWRIAKAGQELRTSESRYTREIWSSQAFEEAQELFRGDEPMHDLRWYTPGKIEVEDEEMQDV